MLEYWDADVETSGLLEDMKQQTNPVLHNFGAINSKTGEVKLFSRSKNNLGELQAFLDTSPTIAMHNGTCFDTEAMTMLGYDASKAKLWDTLAWSWYLYPTQKLHGLAYWGEVFGVPKPPINDWVGLSPEEYDHRVIEDCKIQSKVTRHFLGLLNNLYDSSVGKAKLIDYLAWKMELQRIQQNYRWKLDIDGCYVLIEELEEQQGIRLAGLQASMPPVKVMVKKSRPAKPFLKSGGLSATGLKWDALCKEYGWDFNSIEEYKIWNGQTVPPKATSYSQLKDWLFSMGWIPQTFDYKRNKETGEVRAIPQLSNDDGICPSVTMLREKHPNVGLEHLEGLGIVNHRLSIVRGFIRNVNADGTITASCAGFTNTLRLKHSVLVNLPSTRVPYGERIRALLSTPDGYENIGSDLSSLEDRCKHHFMWKYDPEYVKQQMHPDFDPHLVVCVMGGLLTEAQVLLHKLYKSGDKANGVDYSHIRHMGKGANYGCQYGIGIEGLSRNIGCDTATAAAAHGGYWKLNWSIKKISKATTVKHANGMMWQWNPIAGLWYWLKTDKDRFSTLCQGLGAYIFDMWCFGINQYCLEKFGKCAPFVAQFHDETVLMVKAGSLPFWTKLLKDVIQNLHIELGMNRDLDCEVQTGNNYSEIH